MRRIPENLIEEVRSKSDIVETISTYLPLIKKGKNYWGLCPFHNDSNPSMSVSPERQIYKCFVCNAGGNVFRFIEDFENITFTQAVIKQAHNVNVDLGTYENIAARPVDKRKERLTKLMEDVKDFTVFQLSVKEGAQAKQILQDRGYTPEILKSFDIGVALGGNQIHNFLSAKGYTDEEMIAVDIIRYGNTDIQDVFYNRLMFPIKDVFGNIIAFSARAIEKDNNVKYINTGETELYTKGNHVYNLNHIKTKRRMVDSLILTEGVTDTFAFTMAGHDNVVSLLGVACTDEQVRLLKSSTQSVVLAFDGDKAGRDATYNIGRKLINAHFNVSIWYNDTDMDPDDLYKKSGGEKLSSGLTNALSWYDFLISYGIGQYGVESFENKKRVVGFMVPHLSNADALTQDFYLQKLSKVSGFDINTLKNELTKKERSNTIVQDLTSKQYNYSLTSQLLRAELELLRQMMLSKKAMELYRDKLGFMPNDLAQDFALILIDQYRTKLRIEIADILSLELGEDLRKFIVEFDERLSIQEYDEALVLENIERIKDHITQINTHNKTKEVSKKEDLEEQLKLLQDAIDSKRKK